MGKHESQSPEEAEDRGVEDGIKQSKQPLVNEVISGPKWKGDKNYPRAYKRGFEKGKKRGS